MIIYLIHNFDDIPSEVLEYNPVIINEGNYKEKKDAYKIKGRFAARKTPFIGIIDDDNTLIKGFYSEASSNVFKDFLEYEKQK